MPVDLTLRRLWGLGISLVLTVAVMPYPLMALFDGSEDSHRIHDTVGALQYLPLWALPVFLFSMHRQREGAWRLALGSAVVIAGVGVWAGDLWPSSSWMPLATLLVLWPRDVRWSVQRRSVVGLAAAGVATWVAATVAPGLVRLQQMDMPDPHSARFHFSGTGAAYIALAVAAAVVALWQVGTVLHLTVAASLVLAGVANLVWPLEESSVQASTAWTLVAAGSVVAADCVVQRVQLRRRASHVTAPATTATSSTTTIATTGA
ncbi:MAG: hypothetical protein ACKPDI_09390 [Actinomycetota bacterium]